jgi:hypothetical protein
MYEQYNKNIGILHRSATDPETIVAAVHANEN